MEGKHHEEEEEEEEHETVDNRLYMSRVESFAEHKLQQFEEEARSMLATTNPNKVRFRNKGYKGEYVPPEIQKEFDIPDNLEEHDINYENILRADNTRKRKTPLWSG